MKKLINFTYLALILLVTAVSAQSQSLINLKGKYGVADKDGSIIWEPIYDSVIQYNNSTLFILKKEDKYALTYKVTIDYKSSLEEDEEYWYKGDFIYDEITFSLAGLHYYHVNLCYISLMFKQNGLYGMIDIEASGDTGDGMFIGRKFYVYGLGKFHSSEARYDEIISTAGFDSFYTTKLNGKYGLWDIITREEYPLIFDEEPKKLEYRKRIVKMNGKYGAIQFEKNQGYEFLLPCACSKIKKIRSSANYLLKGDTPYTFACFGQNDTMMIYDPNTGTTQTPLINGLPHFIDTTKEQYYMATYYVKDRSILYIEEANPGGIESDSSFLLTSLAIYDFSAKKCIFAPTGNSALYQVFKLLDPLVLISSYDSIEKLYINEFHFIYSGNSFTRKSSKFATYAVLIECSLDNIGKIFEIYESFPEYIKGQKTPIKYRSKRVTYLNDVTGEFMKRFSKRKKCR